MSGLDIFSYAPDGIFYNINDHQTRNDCMSICVVWGKVIFTVCVLIIYDQLRHQSLALTSGYRSSGGEFHKYNVGSDVAINLLR